MSSKPDRAPPQSDSVAAYGNMTMKDQEGNTTPFAYCDIYRFRESKIVQLISFVIKTAEVKS